MDFERHKKDMEELQALLDNPGSKSEKFTLTSIRGQLVREPYDWVTHVNTSHVANNAWQKWLRGDDTEEAFMLSKNHFLAHAKDMPVNIDSYENYVNVLNNIPNGLSEKEAEGLVELLTNSEYAQESNDLWKVEIFNDAINEVKATIHLEFNSVPWEHGCTFSFTDKRLCDTQDCRGIIEDFRSVEGMSTLDISNVLFILKYDDFHVSSVIDGKYSFDDWSLPDGFEEALINEITSTGYSFNAYKQGAKTFVDAASNFGMDNLVAFLETTGQ